MLGSLNLATQRRCVSTCLAKPVSKRLSKHCPPSVLTFAEHTRINPEQKYFLQHFSPLCQETGTEGISQHKFLQFLVYFAHKLGKKKLTRHFVERYLDSQSFHKGDETQNLQNCIYARVKDTHYLQTLLVDLKRVTGASALFWETCFRAFYLSESFEEAFKVSVPLLKALQNTLSSDIPLMLSEIYKKLEKPSHARILFPAVHTEIVEKDTVASNILSCLARAGKASALRPALEETMKLGLKLDKEALVAVTEFLAKLRAIGEIKRLEESFKKRPEDQLNLSTILNGYALMGDQDNFFRLWNEIDKVLKLPRTGEMYNSALQINATKNTGARIDLVYDEMKKTANKAKSEGSEDFASLQPNAKTFEIMIRHNINNHNAKRIEELLLDMVESKTPISPSLTCKIIDFHNKRRDVTAGMNFIETMMPRLLPKLLPITSRVLVAKSVLYFYSKARRVDVASEVWWNIIDAIQKSKLSPQRKKTLKICLAPKVALSSRRHPLDFKSDGGKLMFDNIEKMIEEHDFEVYDSIFHAVLYHWAKEGNVRMFSATLAKMHSLQMDIKSSTIYTLQMQLYASAGKWDKIKYEMCTAMKLHNISVPHETWLDILRISYTMDGKEGTVVHAAVEMILENMDERGLDAEDTQNALMIMCASCNDMKGLKAIWDSMKRDPLRVHTRTLKLLYFHFDYVHQNDSALDFVEKLSQSRDKLERQERRKIDARILQLEGTNATLDKKKPYLLSNDTDDSTAERIDDIIYRLTHEENPDELFEDADVEEVILPEEKEAVYVRALQRAGVWVARDKKDPVDKLLKTHLMPETTNIEETFRHWLAGQKKRNRSLWVE